MLDDQILALDPATLAGCGQQLFHEVRHEAGARQTQAQEFLGVHQSAGPIMSEYELVALDDLLARAGLGRTEMVADDLEYQIVRGQGEYDHDETAVARRMNETVDRGAQVALQGEIALRFALLGAAENRIQFVDRLARHE